MNYCLFQAFLVYGFYMQASSFLLYGYANMAIGLELKVQNVMRSARSLNFISTVLEGKEATPNIRVQKHAEMRILITIVNRRSEYYQAAAPSLFR